LSSIKRSNSFNWTCKDCKKEYNEKTYSYYCSLCDYDLCEECFGKNKNPPKDNKEIPLPEKHGNESNEANIIKIEKSLPEKKENESYEENSIKIEKSLPEKKENESYEENSIKIEKPLSEKNEKDSYETNSINIEKPLPEKNEKDSYETNSINIEKPLPEKNKNDSYEANSTNIEKQLPDKNENDSCEANSTNIIKSLLEKSGNNSCEANSTSCENSDIDNYVIEEEDDDYTPPKNHRKKKKPVIYLYPKNEMDITVQLEMDSTKNKFTTIYPKFNKENNTWNVHAKPNGDIQLKDKTYPYLFWESNSYFTEEMKEGFIVKGENAESFLEEKLKILGLNDKESTDFITFWLPVLIKNNLSLCSFQSKKFFNDMKLNVTPKPDTMIRIFICIKKIDAPLEIREQNLEKNERKGFTVIEWGGSDF